MVLTIPTEGGIIQEYQKLMQPEKTPFLGTNKLLLFEINRKLANKMISNAWLVSWTSLTKKNIKFNFLGSVYSFSIQRTRKFEA